MSILHTFGPSPNLDILLHQLPHTAFNPPPPPSPLPLPLHSHPDGKGRWPLHIACSVFSAVQESDRVSEIYYPNGTTPVFNASYIPKITNGDANKIQSCTLYLHSIWNWNLRVGGKFSNSICNKRNCLSFRSHDPSTVSRRHFPPILFHSPVETYPLYKIIILKVWKSI